jgi:hypothetical protein
MTDYSIFPKINATLNGCSAVLLVIGRASSRAAKWRRTGR